MPIIRQGSFFDIKIYPDLPVAKLDRSGSKFNYQIQSDIG